MKLLKNKNAWKKYSKKFNGWYTGKDPKQFPVFVSTTESNECCDMNDHTTLCTYHTFYTVADVKKKIKKWKERLILLLAETKEVK